MTLDFLKLHDASLAKAYSARPKKDPTPKRRTKVIEGIDRAIQQLKAGEQKPKRGWYDVRGNVAKCKLKVGNKQISINGAKEFYVPHERAEEFYQNARRSVQAGELDRNINAAVEGGNLLRELEGRSQKRKPLSAEALAERNRKRAATLAAKKAK